MKTLGRAFGALWAAASVSNLGDGIRVTAIPLLAASITLEPAPVAGVTAMVWLPWMLFSLVAGAVVDRVDRRGLIRNVQLLRMLVMAGFFVTVLTETASIPLIYVAAFLIGTGEVFADSAMQAAVPALVAREDLEAANGRLQGSIIVGNELAGPPIGGALFALWQPLAFLVDAVSFGFAGLMLQRIRQPLQQARDSSRSPATLWADVVDGLRYLLHHRLLRTVTIAVSVSNIGTTTATSVGVLFALQVLDLDSVGYGLLITSFGIGGVLGSIVASGIVRRLTRGRTMFVSFLVTGASVALVGTTTNPFVAGAFLAIAGVAGVTFNIVGGTVRQLVVPDRLLGRVIASGRMLGYGGIPVGAVLGGVLGEALGLKWTFIIGGSMMAAVSLLLLPWAIKPDAVEHEPSTV